MWADRVWKQLYVLLSDKLHKLSYRNLQLSVVLPEKKTHKQTQPVFVKRAYGTLGSLVLYLLRLENFYLGLRLMPLNFMHLWLKRVFGR